MFSWLWGNNNEQHPFVKDNTLDERKKLCEEIKQKHEGKIPIIISTKDINLNKDKYVVPLDLTAKQFINCTRNYTTNVNEDNIVFVLVNDILVETDDVIGDIYKKHKSDDGFLYLKMCKE